MHRRIIPALAAVALSVSLLLSGAHAATLDELVEHLAGGDVKQQNIARQIIPRSGAAALRPVVPLLFHENQGVSWAAINVVQDIANNVSAPGREAERAEAAAILLEALAATGEQERQFTLLRILPIVVPEGADLDPIAALLQPENTRERARRALQEINTDGAREALRGALPAADPVFASALMDALDKTGDTEAFPLMRQKLEGGTDGERAAAALALARSGDPALVKPYLELCKNIDINHRPDAEDATLRLAGALASQGGTWEAGMALYKALLAQSESPMVRGGALAGLGRHGDETALDTIIAAWAKDQSGLLEAPAMAAVVALQGPAVADLLIAAYATQPGPVQERLLGIMGRKQDPRYLPLFEQAADLNPAARISAFEQSGLAGAVPLLEAMAAQGSDSAPLALDALARMAPAFHARGDAASAGNAYLAVFRAAQDGPVKDAAFEGVLQNPVPAAYDELQRALGADGVLALPLNVLTGMAQALAGAGRQDEAKAIRASLLGRANDTATVAQLIQLGPADGSAEDFARKLGFINQWKIIAPFPLAGAPDDGKPVLVDGKVDLAATYGDGNIAGSWNDKPGSGAQAIVDLAYLDVEQSRAFAYTIVHVDAGQDAVLRLGSDDGVRAWLNGAKVHDNNTDRGVALDSDLVPVHLNAGDNALLLEIIQHGGGWGFCARLTQPDGTPLHFEQK